MSLEIKVAETHHLEQIVRIEQASFSDPWSCGLLQRKMEDKGVVFYVAERDGSVLGYGILQCVLPEAEVINVVAADGARRQGIGRGVLEALLREAKRRGVETVHLEVREGNLGAIGLYRSLGFEMVGLRKDYYENPREHAVLMRFGE